jgi:hypothetical protein
MNNHSNRVDGQNTDWSLRWVSMLGVAVGWGWAVVAGGGGLWLLWMKGPWPLTNGWFALASGVSACPASAWILKRLTGIGVSGWVQAGFAILFFIAGKIALTVGIWV